jgi:OOP family OmpA-OmpF porin
MFDWLGDGPIIFGHAASWIRRSSYPYLMRLAEFAHDCPTYAIAITGHTDGTGDAAFNQALSEQRAQAIADFLVYLGTASDRLIVAGMGESKPAASNSTVHGREQNRRIELRLVPMAQLAN